MFIPSTQYIVTAGLGFLSTLTDPTSSSVVKGTCLDYAVKQCIDNDGNKRCSEPFLATESTCYNIKWTTDAVLAHTTVEVRDLASREIVFYRDTDGSWTPQKTEMVTLDFMPKIIGQENNTVKYEVTTCT